MQIWQIALPAATIGSDQSLSEQEVIRADDSLVLVHSVKLWKDIIVRLGLVRKIAFCDRLLSQHIAAASFIFQNIYHRASRPFNSTFFYKTFFSDMSMCLPSELGEHGCNSFWAVAGHKHHKDKLYRFCFLNSNSDLVFTNLSVAEKIGNQILPLRKPHVIRGKHGLRFLVALFLRNKRKNLQRKIRRFVKRI